MFSVESAVQLLKPDYILHHVLEAEESHWSKGHMGSDSDDSVSLVTTASSSRTSSSADRSDPGMVLLRHGTSVKKIHDHFSQLEFRKCCLHLAGRKSTFQTMRVVHPSNSSLDDGSAKRATAPRAFVTHLEDKELRAFKHAYLCAAYPVLAAPDPPSPFSPSPVQAQSGPTTPQRGGEASSSHTRETPYSLHDSGLEESEDLAFIPSESICVHLQRAFHLTDDKFRDYRYFINKTYVRKSAQKLLAEELTGQLAVLENNCHPFYKHQDFVPPLGYEIWRKAEYSHITELLGKFWHYSLPFPRNAQDLIGELHSVHEDYRILLTKLLAYEREFHRQAEEEGGMLVSPLSTASVRLLKEFGLRYGVGEQYRRILYLDQISTDFSPSLWYLRHVLSIINSVSDLLPPNRRALAMVRKEHDMLHSCLLRLATQASKAMEQMKSLFPNNKPAGGVELLITVLQRIRDLRVYLQSSSVQQPPSLVATLSEIIQGLFFQTYERCKTVIRTELRHNRDIHVCPRMMNAVIMEMRDEVLDYRNNFEAVFKPYVDITVMAAKAFYSLLMKDVDTLCQQEKMKDNAVDLRMLALVHRLNQLDHDWTAYIKPQDQTWRLSFQNHVAYWGKALQQHMQDLVVETIAGDAFVTQQLHLSNDCSPPLTRSLSSPHTMGSVSLTPSLNSAFNSISSLNRQGSSLGNRHPLGTEGLEEPASVPNRDTPQPNPADDENSSDFLSFSDKRRQCASVPIFSDRPAIVRVVSDAKMSDQIQVRSLRAASVVEDLRGGNDKFAVIRELTGGDVVNGTQGRSPQHPGTSDTTEGQFQPVQEQDQYSVDGIGYYAEADDVRMAVGGSTGSEDESSSTDEDFTFPPLADVTDMNISDSSMSFKEMIPPGLLAHGKLMAKRKSTGGESSRSRLNTKEAAGSRSRTGTHGTPAQGQRGSISQDAEERTKRLEGSTVYLAGRRSCPDSAQNSRKQLPGFQLFPQSLGPSQLSSIHTASIASTVGTDSEHQFLQSVQSTVSFPSPTLSREVVIPVSGSAIDLVVLLQRTLAFGRNLCQAIFPPRYQAVVDRRGGSEGMQEGETAALWSVLETHQRCAHLNIVQVLCQGISVYVDNMLCLDLCAVPKDIAKRIIGSALVEHSVQQQREGKIWGCRHQLQGLLTCYAFHNRKATYLSERYEPVTQKMCVRINNVMACQQFLAWCDKQTQAADVHCPFSANTSTSSQGPGSSTGPTGARSGDCSGLLQSQTTSTNTETSSSSCGDPAGLKRQQLEHTSTHLMSVWSALCRLLAFRINLFLRDGLTLLLNLKPPSVSIAVCLLPLTTFLTAHLDALSSWLYSHSFRRVIEFLWIYIVQDIEMEASKLMSDKGSKLSPHVLLQTVTHLMRFMNNGEKGITRELLLSQADNVVTKLQLFTLSTLQLIALYQRLVEKYMEGEQVLQDNTTNSDIPVKALHQLRKDLQTRRKCFSGAQLVNWIVRNGDLFLSPDELSLCGGVANVGLEGAMAIAQQLLDMQVIVDVEAVNSGNSPGSSLVADQQYPEVSLHGELHSGMNNPTRSRSSCSDSFTDNTPTPVPVIQVSQGGASTTVLAHAEPSSSSFTDSSATAQLSQNAHRDSPKETSPAHSLTIPPDAAKVSEHAHEADKTEDADDSRSGDQQQTSAVSQVDTLVGEPSDRKETVVPSGTDETADAANTKVTEFSDNHGTPADTENDSERNSNQIVSSDKDSDETMSIKQEGSSAKDNTRTLVKSDSGNKRTGLDIDEKVFTERSDDSDDDEVAAVTDAVQQIAGIAQLEQLNVTSDDQRMDSTNRDQTSVGEGQSTGKEGGIASDPQTNSTKRVQMPFEKRGQEDVHSPVVTGSSAGQGYTGAGTDVQTSSDSDVPSAADIETATVDVSANVEPSVSDSAVTPGVKNVDVKNNVTESKATPGAESVDIEHGVTNSKVTPNVDCVDVKAGVTDRQAMPDAESPDIRYTDRQDPARVLSDFEDSGVGEGPNLAEGQDNAAEGQDNIHKQASEESIMAKLAAQLPANAKVTPSYSLPPDAPSPQYPPREGSVYDLDMSSISATPMSFTSLTPFPSLRSFFDNSTQKFYFIPPNPLSVPSSKPDLHQQTHNTPPATSPLDHTLQQIKKSAETSSLAEKCFDLKITPLSILSVMYSRRKMDNVARGFVQQLPEELLEQLSSRIKMRNTECSVL